MGDGINNDNYFSIQGWMVNELGLKGTDLIVYAIIYSFSQDRQSCFRGSISYLQGWCSASRPTIINSLKSLVERGLVEKKELGGSGSVKYCEYKAVLDIKEDGSGLKNLTSKKTLPNIKDNIYTDNINNIINYMNIIIGSKFLTSKISCKLITARLKEGFTLDDFKMVIGYKTMQWKDDPKMSEYLRPQTLFGEKFESYLNSARRSGFMIQEPSAEEEDDGRQ